MRLPASEIKRIEKIHKTNPYVEMHNLTTGVKIRAKDIFHAVSFATSLDIAEVLADGKVVFKYDSLSEGATVRVVALNSVFYDMKGEVTTMYTDKVSGREMVTVLLAENRPVSFERRSVRLV